MVINSSASLIFLCISFVAGVALGRILDFKAMVVIAMALVVVGVLGWKHGLVKFSAGCLAILLAGSLHFNFAYRQNDIHPFYDREVLGIGVILEEPDVRLDKTYLTVGEIWIGDVKIKSRLLLSTGTYPEYQYGQKIRFNTRIQEPAVFEDFSYKDYLSRYGIDAIAYRPEIFVEPGRHGNIFKYWVLGVKSAFMENLSQSLPEPHSALLGGLLLGTKRSLPEEVTRQFQITGVSHIVAISGFNITVVAVAVGWVLGKMRLRKWYSFFIQALAIFGFVIMTGAQASVVRAGIMGVLFLFMSNFNRTYSIHVILTFSAALMLLLNPQVLHFDIGFQLSFGALLGLVYLSPVMGPWFKWVPELFRPFLVATLAAQFFTMPLLLYYFGLLSIIAPVTNILILLVVPAAMLLGALAGVLGFVSSVLAAWASFPTWLILEYILKISEIGSRVPLASVNWSWPAWSVAAYYLGLTVFLKYHYDRQGTVNPANPWNPKLGV